MFCFLSSVSHGCALAELVCHGYLLATIGDLDKRYLNESVQELTISDF